MGIDFGAKKTKINPETYAKALQLFVDMKPLTSGTSRNDQATKDLFITNQLAFHVVGPWVDPTYRQAAQDSGLKYDAGGGREVFRQGPQRLHRRQ